MHIVNYSFSTILHGVCFIIQHQQEKTEFVNGLRIVKESKAFGKTTKPKDENIESTEVHSAGGKEQVKQNVKKKGKDLIY